MIIRIGLGRGVETIDEKIDLRDFEANCLQIEIELQLGKDLELFAEHPLVPGRILGQAVVGEQEGHALRFGEMT